VGHVFGICGSSLVEVLDAVCGLPEAQMKESGSVQAARDDGLDADPEPAIVTSADRALRPKA